MSRIQTLIFRLLVIAGALSLSQSSLAAKSKNQINSIFQFKLSANPDSLLELSMIDPVLGRDKITNQADLEATIVESENYESDLKLAKGLRQKEILKNLVKNYILIHQFIIEYKSGKIDNEIAISNRILDVKNARSKIALYSAKYVSKLKSSDRERVKAQFYGYSATYFMGKKGAATNGLKKIKAKLPSYLKRRADLLINYYDLRYRKRTSASKNLKTVIPSLPTEATVAAQLEIAKVDKNYRKYLYSSSLKAYKLSDKLQDEVLSSIIKIWRKRSPKSYSNPPIKMSLYKNNGNIIALQEKVALEQVNNKNYRKAIGLYLNIKKSISPDSNNIELIDFQIENISYLKYRRDGNSSDYQKVATAITKQYDRSPADATARRLKVVDRRHRSIVVGELDKALRATSKTKARYRAINAANIYASASTNSDRNVFIKEKIAKIYTVNGEPKKAVSYYEKLISENSSRKKIHLTEVVKVQQTLATWPAKAPWTGTAKGSSSERSKLADFYAQLSEISSNWNHIAHLGLLYRAIGKKDTSDKVLWDKLNQSPKGFHAKRALGLFVYEADKSKEWQKLEDATRFGLNKNLSAVHKNAPLPIKSLFGLALLEGGIKKYKESEGKIAVVKLTEFIKKFPNHNRRVEGRYFLGKSQYLAAEYKDAVQTMTYIVDNYKRSKYFEDSAYLGGTWSVELDFAESAISLLDIFVKSTKNTSRSVEVEKTLYSLHLGYGHSLEAATIASGLAKNKNLSKADRVDFAISSHEIIVDSGSDQEIRNSSQQLKSLNKGDAESLALALQPLIAMYKADGKTSKISEIISDLEKVNQSSDIVNETLSEAHFSIAEMQFETFNFDVLSIELKDPTKELKARFEDYNRIKNLFLKSCMSVPTTHCAGANYKVNELAEQSISTIENFEIAQNFAEAEVRNFESTKSYIIEQLTRDAVSGNQRALQMAREGFCSPSWTSAILWKFSDDWVIDQQKGAGASGYFEWAPSINDSNMMLDKG